jgi:hypothetical protein
LAGQSAFDFNQHVGRAAIGYLSDLERLEFWLRHVHQVRAVTGTKLVDMP